MAQLLQAVLDGTGRPLVVFVLASYVPIFVVLYFYRKDMREVVAVLKEALAVVKATRGDGGTR